MARLIMNHCPEAPRLPIMTRSFRWMYEGLPCLHLDHEKKQVYMLPPKEREAEVLEFYDRVEADDLDYFATSEAAAPFYYRLIEELQKVSREMDGFSISRTHGPGRYVQADQRHAGCPA